MCTAGPQAGLRQLVRSFMRNLDDPSAMFAMDRIRIVSAQAAVGTFNVEPCRAKHQLNQADEEGDPEDHDGDRQESSRCPWERDVPEPRGRKGRDGEVEGIRVVHDRWVRVHLGLIDHCRHDEDEDSQVQSCEDDVLMPVEEGKVTPESVDQLIGPKQAEGSSDSQECQVFADDGGEQGDDDDDIGHAVQVCELTQAGPGDQHTDGKVRQDEESEYHIEEFDQAVSLEKGRQDQEQDDRQIEKEQRVAEGDATRSVRFIEPSQPIYHAVHRHETGSLS